MESKKKRFQFVWWPRLWPWFFWRRYSLCDTDLTYIYRWIFYLWPLEIRRWETRNMEQVSAIHTVTCRTANCLARAR